MGVVYRARQLNPDRIVALKLVRMDRLEELLPRQRQEWLERFHQEARATARLDHDHVATVYEVGEVDGRPFYSMAGAYAYPAPVPDLPPPALCPGSRQRTTAWRRPGKEERERDSSEMLFVGWASDGRQRCVAVAG